jgi:S1-C subfamily serine protease
MKTLLSGGRIVRPSLGVVAVSLTPQRAFVNDLAVERGALVVRVDPGGPAEAARIERGDVITAVGSVRVTDLHHLHEVLFRRKPGDTVALTLWRDGRTLTVAPVLEELR